MFGLGVPELMIILMIFVPIAVIVFVVRVVRRR